MHVFVTIQKLIQTTAGLLLFGFCLAAAQAAGELKDPEDYKHELLAIEKRLDAKLKELDEKLERLEQLESAATSPVKSPRGPTITLPDVSPTVEPTIVVDTKNTAPVKSVTLSNPGTRQTETAEKPTLAAAMPTTPNRSANLSYGNNGFEFRTDNNRFSLAIQNRIQLRYSNPFDRDPRTLDDLSRNESTFRIRRARTRLRGHAYWPWLKYYLQYDWSQPVLRDLNLTIDKYQWGKLWFGRGKVIYNDERVTSSANQQFVNRSIVNDLFTVDRQQGIQLSGNLFPKSWYDISYYTGVFTGLGVGENSNDDSHMMYSSRIQWNVLGGAMPFSQSDLEYHEAPALNLAYAAVTNRSRCTVFQTDNRSCRNLPGFAPGLDGQYRINQMMEEVRFKWRGFSLQHEMHWKEIIDVFSDRDNPARKTNMIGGLVQAGYFPHYSLPVIPKNLEFAGRYAFVDPNTRLKHDLQEEYSGVMTYFLNGHKNKVNFQVSHLIIQQHADQRFWLQWDLTF